MGRQKSPWGARDTLFLLVISYLCCFFIPIIITLLVTSFAFVLAHTSVFVMTLVLALLPVFACRALFVEEVPEKRLGILVNRSETFKALLPPGKYFMLPGRESIKDLLSLEPASVQVPVVGLKASDGEIAPQVVLFRWRIQDTIIQALSGSSGQQVQGMIVGGQRALEREARSHLEAALRRCVARYSVSALQTLLADGVHHVFEEEVQQAANKLLQPLGLEIEQVELIGLVKAQPGAPAGGKASAAAAEAQQILAEVYKKLDPMLRAHTFDTAAQQVAESAWNAYETLSEARKTLNHLNLAFQAYNGLVLDMLDAMTRQKKDAPDQQEVFRARQKASDELNSLQTTIGTLGQLLIDLELQAKRIKSSFFTLTPSEIERLLEVLEAIEQKKLALEQVYP